ncbi:MAG TPA: hypothetical protein VMB21_05710 [Candidatus Limnocylindria bacterium]|nr:hypothetical protein [Candidatus Limnocylindria bacterium]
MASPLIVIGRFFNACVRRGRSAGGLWLFWLLLVSGGPAVLGQSTDTNASPVISTNTMGLGVLASPIPATLLEALTYTLSVTNFYPSPLTGATVTNVMPDGVFLISASATNGVNGIATNGNNVVFFLAPLTNLQVVNLTVAVQPTAVGQVTNLTAVGQTLIFYGTNPPPVTNISTVVAGHIDLQAGVSGPVDGVLVNDRLQFQVSVTNLGPDDASGVLLSTTLPAGTSLLGISPATTLATVTTQTVVVRFDTLAAGAGQQIALDLQLTNTGLAVFAAVAGTADGFFEDNLTNNTQTLSLLVGAPLTANLTATLIPPQHFNPQTGLTEQVVRLTNEGTNDIPDARLVLGGLTNWLVNAAGTNGSDPFVVLGTPLGTNQSVDLLLELFVPGRVPVADPFVSPISVAAATLPLPIGTPLGTNRIVRRGSEGVFLEFPTVAGHSYAVIYSDNPGFTNAVAVRPNLLAPADVTQWLDYGPPGTKAAPSNTPTRFYRVLELP